MSGVFLASAVDWITRYPVTTLDATSLRNLRVEIVRAIEQQNRVRERVACHAAAVGRPEDVDEWDAEFIADASANSAALRSIDAELGKRRITP